MSLIFIKRTLCRSNFETFSRKDIWHMLSTYKQVIIKKKRFEHRLLLPNTEICTPYNGR